MKIKIEGTSIRHKGLATAQGLRVNKGDVFGDTGFHISEH